MNIFDKPAEQPLLNTYVPVPWEHIFKLVDYGNKKAEQGDAAYRDVTTSLTKQAHLKADEPAVQAWQKEYLDEISKADKETNLIAKTRILTGIQHKLQTDTRRIGWENRVKYYDEFSKNESKLMESTGGHDLNAEPIYAQKRAAQQPLYLTKEDGSIDWDNPNPNATIDPSPVVIPWKNQQDYATKQAAAFKDTDLGSTGWGYEFPWLLSREHDKGVSREHLNVSFGVLTDDMMFKRNPKTGELDYNSPMIPGTTKEKWDARKAAALSEGIDRWSTSEVGKQFELEVKDQYTKELPYLVQKFEQENPDATDEERVEFLNKTAKTVQERVYKKYVDFAVDQNAHTLSTRETVKDPNYEARANARANAEAAEIGILSMEGGKVAIPKLTNISGAPITNLEDLVIGVEERSKEIKRLQEKIDANPAMIDPEEKGALENLLREQEIQGAWLEKLANTDTPLGKGLQALKNAAEQDEQLASGSFGGPDHALLRGISALAAGAWASMTHNPTLYGVIHPEDKRESYEGHRKAIFSKLSSWYGWSAADKINNSFAEALKSVNEEATTVMALSNYSTKPATEKAIENLIERQALTGNVFSESGEGIVLSPEEIATFQENLKTGNAYQKLQPVALGDGNVRFMAKAVIGDKTVFLRTPNEVPAIVAQSFGSHYYPFVQAKQTALRLPKISQKEVGTSLEEKLKIPVTLQDAKGKDVVIGHIANYSDAGSVFIEPSGRKYNLNTDKGNQEAQKFFEFSMNKLRQQP